MSLNSPMLPALAGYALSSSWVLMLRAGLREGPEELEPPALDQRGGVVGSCSALDAEEEEEDEEEGSGSGRSKSGWKGRAVQSDL